MDHVGVVEAAHHVDDGVHLADVGQELVAQALALGSPLHQAGDIHKFDHRRGDLLGVIEVSQELQPLIRHGHHAHVGVDGAEGIVGGLRPGLGQRVEEGTLSHVGKAYDS